MPFTPLQNYTGYNHVLQAGACFVHPGNGNIYFTACEQKAGTQQDLSVYRMLANGSVELVKRYRGTIDAEGQITMGSAVIGQGGGMIVATSLTIPGVPKVTNTGWQGCWIREPNIDAPWSLTSAASDPALLARVAALEHLVAQQSQAITAIEAALGNIGSGGDGLSTEDRAALDWIAVVRAAIRMA